jgi:hypothetical protein
VTSAWHVLADFENTLSDINSVVCCIRMIAREHTTRSKNILDKRKIQTACALTADDRKLASVCSTHWEQSHFICCSQNKLDEALLTSGRVADAISSLLEWLGKAEASLAEDQPIMGDTDTIHMLIEQHKVRHNSVTYCFSTYRFVYKNWKLLSFFIDNQCMKYSRRLNKYTERNDVCRYWIKSIPFYTIPSKTNVL